MICFVAIITINRKECGMVTEKMLSKFGLLKDKNVSKLKEIFKNNTELKEIHIDIYLEDPLSVSTKPFMLLLRAIEKDAMVSNDNYRLILKRSDTYETHFVNIPFSEIKECFFKTFNSNYEFILNIQNIYYRITILT